MTGGAGRRVLLVPDGAAEPVGEGPTCRRPRWSGLG